MKFENQLFEKLEDFHSFINVQLVRVGDPAEPRPKRPSLPGFKKFKKKPGCKQNHIWLHKKACTGFKKRKQEDNHPGPGFFSKLSFHPIFSARGENAPESAQTSN